MELPLACQMTAALVAELEEVEEEQPEEPLSEGLVVGLSLVQEMEDRHDAKLGRHSREPRPRSNFDHELSMHPCAVH